MFLSYKIISLNNETFQQEQTLVIHKMFYICVPLPASQRTILSCQILHPHCSCKHLDAIFIWISQHSNFALTYLFCFSQKKYHIFQSLLKHCHSFIIAHYSNILSFYADLYFLLIFKFFYRPPSLTTVQHNYSQSVIYYL